MPCPTTWPPTCLAQIDAAAADAESISAGGGEDIATEAGTLATTLESVAAAIPDVATLDPEVLVRPFEADTANIAPVEIEPVDFFAPRPSPCCCNTSP